MGKAKKMIDELIEKKAQGNSFQINNIKMKLMFKGIMPDEITDETPDTEELISKIESVADQFNLSLTTNN
jgi:spore coat protein CotF